jgi:hypothetical protein
MMFFAETLFQRGARRGLVHCVALEIWHYRTPAPRPRREQVLAAPIT